MKNISFVILALAAVLVASCSKSDNDEPELQNYVDLGLPSGLKWATCNLGAEKSTEAGYYIAWGETAEKTLYNQTDYKYCVINADSSVTWTKYVTSSKYGTPDNLTELESCDDAAQQILGNGWRMPTKAEMEELLTLDYELDTVAKGIHFIGNNGNTIFLPVAGTKNSGSLLETTRGYYWTSTLVDTVSMWAEGLFFTPKSAPQFAKSLSRVSGRLIRPVHE